MQIISFSPFGYEGALVTVEVDIRRGIPAIDLVGLADGAVKESRERMRSAIRNSGFDFPPERVLISLSPADVKKEGAGFDLAIALAVLCASSSAQKNCDQPGASEDTESGHTIEEQILVMGELELNGNIRAVRGIHAAASTASASGIRHCIVPAMNADEAREVPGMRVYGAKNLSEAFAALSDVSLFSASCATNENRNGIPKGAVNIQGVLFSPSDSTNDYSTVFEQPALIRALQIAAAGGHNLLAYGPPGCGKTLALQRFSSLLPLLSAETAQPVTRIYSIAGRLPPGASMVRIPPFRQPHQTASIEGMCGGGPHCVPGEISLAHNGVLFLDEAAEFKTSVLQMLRVPLESGMITLSRAGRSTTFPARFQLLMATNPCPCGFYGSNHRLCLCSAHSIEQYWKKFSGPLLDRIDIRIPVEQAKETSPHGWNMKDLQIPIAHAVTIQHKRQKKRNAHLSPAEISTWCSCTDNADALLRAAESTYHFSSRAVASCLKLARTIADMAQKETINSTCMEEAISYRKNEGGLSLE